MNLSYRNFLKKYLGEEEGQVKQKTNVTVMV